MINWEHLAIPFAYLAAFFHPSPWAFLEAVTTTTPDSSINGSKPTDISPTTKSTTQNSPKLVSDMMEHVPAVMSKPKLTKVKLFACMYATTDIGFLVMLTAEAPSW